jgi:hypothetical protein
MYGLRKFAIAAQPPQGRVVTPQELQHFRLAHESFDRRSVSSREFFEWLIGGLFHAQVLEHVATVSN